MLPENGIAALYTVCDRRYVRSFEMWVPGYREGLQVPASLAIDVEGLGIGAGDACLDRAIIG